jgi:hypothetical protein
MFAGMNVAGMNGGLLRAALVVAGLALVAGATFVAMTGCVAAAWRLGFVGVVLTAAGIFERWRYKRLAASYPGAGWVATGERFVDPESGVLVTVYFHPPSGERRYVAGSA